MGELLDYLDGFLRVSEESRALITANIKDQTVKKNDSLWRSGDRCRSLYFIRSGIFRLFFYTEHGEEVTVHFAGAGQFIADIESVNTHTPSAVTCMAAADAEVVVIDASAQGLFESAIPEWHQLVRKITEKALYDKIRIKDSLAHREAKDKYKTFVTLYPDIVPYVQASHIASYLGISQYTLSHIKSEMAHSNFFAK